MRSFGVEGLQQKLREHIRLSTVFYEKVKMHSEWELMAPFVMNVLCIRFHPNDITDENELNNINEKIVREINSSGKFYLSGTKLNGKYVIRVVICLLYTSDAADERSSVDLGGRRIIKKKNT